MLSEKTKEICHERKIFRSFTVCSIQGKRLEIFFRSKHETCSDYLYIYIFIMFKILYRNIAIVFDIIH